MKFRLFRPKPNSPTFIGDGDRDSAVLFVHGLGGSYWTWNSFALHLAEQWREADSFALEYDEFYGSQGFFHRLPIVKHFLKIRRVIIGPGIDTLSRHLRTAVDELCRDYDHVIIIAHSMGGLIARKYIVDLVEDRKSVGKVKALITYATPHQGSVLANKYLILCYHLLRFFMKDSRQITQLSKNNDFIFDLNKVWSDLRVEDKLDFKRVVGYEDWVVDAESSGYKDDVNVSGIANKNHFTIIKPNKPKDLAFMVTYNYLKDFKALLEMREEADAARDIAAEEFESPDSE